MWIVNGCSGGTVTTFNAIAMRTGFDPTTLTWTDVRTHFLPKRLDNDPGCVVLAFHDTEPRSLRIRNRAGDTWRFYVCAVALEGADVTARECRVRCVSMSGGGEDILAIDEELPLTAALLAIALRGTIYELSRTDYFNGQYKNKHWDDAAAVPPPPPVLLEIPPMPDFHPQLMPS